jgi:ketosteroid isomerase-like protein
MSDNLTLIRRYLDAIERDDEDALVAALDADVVQREHPNRLLAAGATRSLAMIIEGSRRGRAVVRDQRYAILSSVSEGEKIAVEALWTAILRVPLPVLGRDAGEEIHAKFAIFVTFRGGKILSQDNYDCFLD